jgi:hypothetical protein
MKYRRIFGGRIAGLLLGLAGLLYSLGVAVDPLVHALLDERQAEASAAALAGDIPSEVPEVEFRLDCSVCKIVGKSSQPERVHAAEILLVAAQHHPPGSVSGPASPAFLHPPSRGPPPIV